MNASPFAKLSPELRLTIYDLVLRRPCEVPIVHDVFQSLPFRRGQRPDLGKQRRLFGLRTRQSKDVRICIYDDQAEWLLAITQTCRQIRIEATDVLYAVNDFHIYFSRISKGQILIPNHYPMIMRPLVKFLDAVETHYETSRSRFPALRVKIVIDGRASIRTTDPRKEEPMDYLLRQLLELTRAYTAKGRELDLAVVLASRSLEGHPIVIRHGFSCLAKVIDSVQASGTSRHTIEMLKRWQQVFVS